MRVRDLCVLVGLVLVCATATPATAGISPYFRFDYGGHQLKMTEGNRLIRENEEFFQSQGLTADFKTIGSAYGPSASLGLWIFPAFRVGAAYSYARSQRENNIHVPGQLYFAQELDLRMTEIGAEAAVRVTQLGGLTLGGSVAKGRAVLLEGYAAEDWTGQLYYDATAKRTKTTYGAYVAFDQTNIRGMTGSFRVGYLFRDMGKMPSHVVSTDGSSTWETTTETIPLDYSGFYVRVGVGYDLRR